MSKRLTAKFVEHVKPGDSRREIPDGGSGLYLVVQPSGHTSFITRTRLNSVPIKVTHHQAAGLAEARVLNAEAIKQARTGIDPRNAKKLAKAQRLISEATTFAAVTEVYLSSDKVKKLRSVDQVRDRLERIILPMIGDTPIADLKRSQITALLDYIEKRHGPVQADRCLSIISCVLNFHAKRTDDFIVPLCRGMNRTSNKERARDRILTDDEIRKIWNYGNAFLRFLLLVGCRRNEAAGMQWREIDGDVWTLPASRNKVKTDLARPLSRLAMSMLPPRGHDDEFVFRPGSDRPFNSFDLLVKKVQAATGTSDWWIHDIRRTARSLLSKAGISADIAELALGHVLKGVRATYDRHDYSGERRQAFEALACEVERITTDPPKGSNVRQLKRA